MTRHHDVQHQEVKARASGPRSSRLRSALLLLPLVLAMPLAMGESCNIIGQPRVQELDDCYLSIQTNVCGAIPGCDVAYDTATNLSWLSWDATDGQDVDEVLHDLVDVAHGGTGSSHEGWRYASLVEVCDFARNGAYVYMPIDCFGADQSWRTHTTTFPIFDYDYLVDKIGQTNTSLFSYNQTAAITSDVSSGERVVALFEEEGKTKIPSTCEGPDAGQECNNSQDCTPDPSCWQGICACISHGYTVTKPAFFDPTQTIAPDDSDTAIGHALVRPGNLCNH